MINTTKSIVKNFKACCLNDDEELVYHFLSKSSRLKKMFVLAYTNQKRFLMGSVKLFGKMTLIDEFVAEDIKFIEMGSKTAITTNYFVKVNIKGNDDVFKIQMENPSDVIKIIYNQRPETKPSYLKDFEYLEQIALKKDLLLTFCSNKLLLLKFDGKNVNVDEEIEYDRISDFDVYSQKIGMLKNLYLEIDGKPRLYLTDITKIKDENFVNYFSNFLRFTNIKKTVPSHMEADEQEIVTYNLTKSMGAGLGNKKLRIASRNIYFLEKNKTGKLEMQDKIEISNIESIKSDTFGSSLKPGGSNNHEIIIRTKDGKKINIWNTDEERFAANIGIEYIQKNIT